MDFDYSPFLVIWEVTQACDLACVHCRASAVSYRHPLELTTREGLTLLAEIRSMGDPLMVFTGGDPLRRPDLFQLLEESVRLGLRTTVTPSATSLLTPAAIERFQAMGVSRMAISLDGADADDHDSFRQANGSFHRSLLALEEARRIGLETQVNTTVTRHNLKSLLQVAKIVTSIGARLWSVFFLVTTGRADRSDDLAAEEYEFVFELLYQLSKTVLFDIKTTEAQHFRRYVAQRKKAEGSVRKAAGIPSIIQRQLGINDGKGLVFISHLGDIYPSGFLPISAGNVRQHSLAHVYRNSKLFRSLRDSNQLEGKCGMCEFRNLCGGSRSRAYALTGNYLAEESRCMYQPQAFSTAGMNR